MPYLETLNAHPFRVSSLVGNSEFLLTRQHAKYSPLSVHLIVVKRKSWENHEEMLKSSRIDLNKIHLWLYDRRREHHNSVRRGLWDTVFLEANLSVALGSDPSPSV